MQQHIQKQRRCRWAARLKKLQLRPLLYAAYTTNRTTTAVTVAARTTTFAPSFNITTATKTDRYKRQIQNQQQQHNNRQRWQTTLQADITINLLSDDDEDVSGAQMHSYINTGNGNASSLRTSTPITIAGGSCGSGLNPLQLQMSPTSGTPILPPGSIFVHPGGSFQLSMVPNITLVPVQLQPLSMVQHQPQQHQHQQKLPAANTAPNLALYRLNNNSNKAIIEAVKRKRKAPRPKKRYAAMGQESRSNIKNINNSPFNNDISIVLTDDEDDDKGNYSKATTAQALSNPNSAWQPKGSAVGKQQKLQRHNSPPPLAPLSHNRQHVIASETVEEVTVSLVPRSATTGSGSCARQQQIYGQSTPTMATTTNGGMHMQSEHGHDDVTATFPMLPDETTVHTVIANRIYELSLSKLREGLASSGMPEFSNNETTNVATANTTTAAATASKPHANLADAQTSCRTPLKISPRQRRVSPSPISTALPQHPAPAPISLKLSSDLSISLISDDEGDGNESRSCAITTAAEARAAAKLLQQQQPQLSVVQHLQYHPSVTAAVALATPQQGSRRIPKARGATMAAAAARPTAAAVALAMSPSPSPSVTTTTPRKRKLG